MLYIPKLWDNERDLIRDELLSEYDVPQPLHKEAVAFVFNSVVFVDAVHNVEGLFVELAIVQQNALPSNNELCATSIEGPSR